MPARRRLNRVAGHVLAPRAVRVAERESVAPRPSRKYEHGEPMDEPMAMPLPAPTVDIDRAKDDLTEFGMCIVDGGMSPELLERCRERLDRQMADEETILGERLGRRPPPADRGKGGTSALTNKGAVFIELIEHPVINELCGYVLGRQFLLSSAVGGSYRGPEPTPQPLHRDQGFVPASAPFPAVLNVFFILDDFYAENGGAALPHQLVWPADSPLTAWAVGNQART